MSSFKKTKAIEAEAVAILLPWLNSRQIVAQVDDYSAAKDFVGRGDFKITYHSGKTQWVELKAEAEDKYGNFFLEVFSNRKSGRAGWFVTSQADKLFYFFVKERILRTMFMNELRNNIQVAAYPIKKQHKYWQANDTWGHCVPIHDIELAVSMKTYRIRE